MGPNSEEDNKTNKYKTPKKKKKKGKIKTNIRYATNETVIELKNSLPKYL